MKFIQNEEGKRRIWGDRGIDARLDGFFCLDEE